MSWLNNWYKKIVIIIFITIIFGIAYTFVTQENTQVDANQVNYSEKIDRDKKPLNKGFLMFRGNANRNFYGTGPINQNLPEIIWRYGGGENNNQPLCATSFVGAIGKKWCGNGWTGQPTIWEHDNVTEIIVNAYDKGIHFINANTGKPTREPFYTGDIIKGTVTIDPDFPILYSGSRDNFYRIIALDREKPTELWRIEARVQDGVWNDDWDPNGIIVNDILYTGAENGWFHAIKLNRGYDANGKVTVNPVEIFKYPTYADGYIDIVGDNDLSIESSPLLVGETIYIANSGGRIMGFDTKIIEQRISTQTNFADNTPIVFDFWTGDDTDATLVSDDDGYIYAVTELERENERNKQVGQIMKIDPNMYNRGSGPFVWGIPVPARGIVGGGVWATPAIRGDRLYVSTNPGDVLIINTKDGKVLDKKYIGEHAWSSPTLVDNNLIVASCRGIIYNFDITNDSLNEVWQKQIPGGSCIESTPAIWNGQIFFGSRDGYIYSIK